MNKTTLATIIATILIFGGIAFFAWKSGTPTTTTEPSLATKILFIGTGCPHCANVEKFVADNGIDKKVTFETREVYLNRANAALMTKRAASCGMATDQLGVPLFWDGSKCYSGDTDIIKYLREQAGVSEAGTVTTQPAATSTK